MKPANAFEAVCGLGADRKWCWNINCTTCGHLDFRVAFRKMGMGLHPESEGWKLNRKEIGQPASPRTTKWITIDRNIFISTLADASIGRISQQCCFPDWLGYLGLGLYYSERLGLEARPITISWASQFQEMGVSESIVSLQTLIDDSRSLLRWQQLEAIEYSLRL